MTAGAERRGLRKRFGGQAAGLAGVVVLSVIVGGLGNLASTRWRAPRWACWGRC